MNRSRRLFATWTVFAILVLFLPTVYAVEAADVSNTQSTSPEAEEGGPLQFQEVVQVEGASKDQLYSAALAWFGQTYGNGREVLQTQDREGGTLVGRALFEYEPVVFVGSNGLRGVVRYTMTLEFKDGRYRYTLGPFAHEGNSSNPGGQFSFGVITTDDECPYRVYGTSKSSRAKTWADLKAKSQNEADVIIASLKAKLATAATAKDDW